MIKKIIFILLIFSLHENVFSRQNSTNLYKLAVKKAQEGKIDESIILFKQTIKLSPYYSLAHYGLGKAYLYRETQIDLAIKQLKVAATYDKKLAKANFYLGMALMLGKKYNSAIHEFKKCYKIDDTYIEALYNIGSIFDIIGDSFNSQKYFNLYYYRKNKDNQLINFNEE